MEAWHTEKFKICCPLSIIHYSFHNYVDLYPEGMMNGFSNNEYFIKIWDSVGNERGIIALRIKSQLKATKGDFEEIEDTSRLDDISKAIILNHLAKVLKNKFKGNY